MGKFIEKGQRAAINNVTNNLFCTIFTRFSLKIIIFKMQGNCTNQLHAHRNVSFALQEQFGVIGVKGTVAAHLADATIVVADNIRARVSTETRPVPHAELAIIRGLGHHHAVLVDQECSVDPDPVVVPNVLPEHTIRRLGDLNASIVIQVSI